MASGNIFKLLAEIKALKLDYAGAVRYLTDKGVEVTGIIKQGLNNFFKKNKARDVDFGSVVKKIPYDDFNVPFNPNNPLKNYSKGKDGVGTLFKNKSKTLADELAQAEGVETFETILPTKKLPDIKMGSRINYEAIADKAGIDVELIRGKNWEEIMEIIKGKADGGRVGFAGGGRNMMGDIDPNNTTGWQESGAHISPSEFFDTGGGDDGSPVVIPNSGGGGNNLHLEPVIINKGGPYPQIDKLGFQGHIMNLIARGVVTVEDVVKGEIDPDLFLSYAKDNFNIGAQKTKDAKNVYASGQIGPVTVAGAYGDNTKGIGAGINSGPFQSGLTYNFEDNPSLGMSYNNNGFGVGMNYDFQGNPDVNVTFKKSFKDGGRVGFEIGGLSGEAQSIYDAWISAGHSEADTLDYLTSRGMYNAGEGEKGITSILNTQPGIINQGGGDDNYFGPGATTKEFNVQQWGAIDGPPGSMGWKDVSITGYETPGGWKTKQGKNIIHAGLFTGDPEEGDIKGTPLDWRGIPSNLWGLGAKAITKLKDWTSGQQNNQNEIIEEEQKKKAAALILASQAAESGDIITRGPIGGQPGINEGLDFSVEDSGPTVDGQTTEWGDELFSRGGLATMFTRRR